MQVLFRGAVAVSSADSADSAALFYPHSYLFGFLKRKAEVMAAASNKGGTAGMDELAQSMRADALRCAGGGCARVLRSYRCYVAEIGAQRLCMTGPHCSMRKWIDWKRESIMIQVARHGRTLNIN